MTINNVMSADQSDSSFEQCLKHCSKCGEKKERSQFRRHSKTKDGLQYWCMKCQSESRRRYLKTTEGRQQQRLAQGAYRKTPKGKEAQRKSQRKFSKTPKGKLIRLRVSARSRGLSATISAGDFDKWWKNTPHICGYCGRGALVD